MVISKIDSNDIIEAVMVIKESILSCEKDHGNVDTIIDSWIANKTVENMNLWVQKNSAYKLKEHNKILGIIMFSKEGEVLLNYVLPQKQNQGVGKALLNFIKKEAQNNQISKLFLESTLTAKDFYIKNGFHIVNSIIENNEIIGFHMECALEI